MSHHPTSNPILDAMVAVGGMLLAAITPGEVVARLAVAFGGGVLSYIGLKIAEHFHNRRKARKANRSK